MSKSKSCTEYWLNTEDATFRGDFEGMYQNIADPWGCESKKSSLNNKIFIDITFDGDCRFDRILDIGCGLGGLLNLVVDRNQGGYALGLDVSQTAISKAKERYPNLNFQCRDIRQSPLVDDQFDLIIISEVLWYVLDGLPLFFLEIKKLMAPDAILAIHQYFPENQRFGKDVINGLPTFLKFLNEEARLLKRRACAIDSDDGIVLLANFKKEK